MGPERIDVRQALEVMEKDRDAVYIDVRTEEEFAQGHPDKAINIPVGTPNPLMQRLDANPDFVEVVEACVPKQNSILIGCKTGPRAEMAAGLLARSGYENVRWVLGGFYGMTDPVGRVIAPGWRQLGYPESREVGEGVGYSSLKRKAGKA